jgi:hypothetical protein
MATFSNGESGFSVRTKINDVLQHMDGTAGTLVVNEAGADVDFRVESDTNANAIYMDGATGNVGLGTGTPAVALHTVGRIRAQKVGTTGAYIQLSAEELTSGYASDIVLNDTGLTFRVGSSFRGFVFDQNGSERMRITDTGNVAIGSTTTSGARLRVSGVDNSFIALINGASFGVRIGSTAGVGANIDAVDVTGVASFQPMSLGGSIVAMQTTGAERMRIDSAGNVGINTVSPVNRLQIVSTPPSAVPAAGASGHQLGVGTTPYGVAVGALSDGTGYIQATRWDGTATNYNLLLQPNGSNVGIGTATPSTRLDIDAGLLRFADGWGPVWGTGANQPYISGSRASNFLNFGVSGSERMRIDNLGNVGIGTSSPTARLDVAAISPVIRANATGGGTPTLSLFSSGVADWNLRGGGSLAFFQDTTERMRLDSAGNIGIGITPTTGGYGRSIEFSAGAPASGALTVQSIDANNSPINLTANAYSSGPGAFRYFSSTASATRYEQVAGQHRWFNAPIGTAGNVITFTQAMTLDASGRLGIGVTSPTANLQIGGVAGGDRTFQMGSSGATRGVLSTSGSGTFSIGATNDSTAGSLVFQSGGALAERMRINELGDVGIGTNSPANFGAGYTNVVVFGSGGGVFQARSGGAGLVDFRMQADTTALLDVNSNHALVFRTNAVERMRLDTSGNLLVGTTVTTGAASNTAFVTSGGYRTAAGGVSTTSGVAATAFSITAGNRGRYDIVAMINNSGDASLNSSFATVVWDGSTGRIVANNGTNLTITLSGSNVQVTQSSGSAQTVNWSFARIVS